VIAREMQEGAFGSMAVNAGRPGGRRQLSGIRPVPNKLTLKQSNTLMHPWHILALGVIRNAREENQRYFWDKYAERQRDSDNGSGFLGLGNGRDN